MFGVKMHRQRLQVGLILLLTSMGFPAVAAQRVALVIGNGAYKAQNLLINPPNDAHLISKALNKVNFETIETKINLGIGDFRQALRRFQSQANGAEVALVYFAGHGIEANGANWLIPTDADLADDRDLEYEAIKADLVLQALQGARMRVLVLDACRDNPFGRNWRASIRGTTSGLGKLEADDVLVLFAAAPGRTASDGVGSNSPFAEALAKRLPEPGLAIQLLGGNVRDDVLAATGGNQRPYVSASITGRPFYLVPTEQPASAPTQVPPVLAADSPPPQISLLSGWSTAEREWQQYGKDATDIRLLEAFKEKHKADPVYVRLAEARIEELKKQQASVPTLPSPKEPALPLITPTLSATTHPEPTNLAGAKAEGTEQQQVRNDPERLLGTWNCHASYRVTSKDTKQVTAPRTHGTIVFDKYDGKYYWAHGTERYRSELSSTRSKYWSDGDKLYRLVYWSSDARATRYYINRAIPVSHIGTKLTFQMV
jgi:hypothetical protein